MVVSVGERLRLYVHLDNGNGGLMFLALSGQVSWTNGHQAELALYNVDEETERALLVWLGTQSDWQILE